MNGPPSSVLIVGSGVFGLSTAWALSKRPYFASTSITVADNCRGSYPAQDCASSDSSRIIRADYADAQYTVLAVEAQKEWRKQGDDDLGGQGRYTESGFVLTAYGSSNVKVGKKSGMDFTRESWANVVKFADQQGFPPERIRTLEDNDALNKCLGTDGNPGDWGYLNTLSGWADATKGMKWLYERVKATERVDFVDAEVERLVPDGKRVVGAQLTDGKILKADVVIVAAGAWTGSLVDLRGRTEATGHPLAYIDITEEEQQVLSKQPVALNLTSGFFVIPPRDLVLKVARHSFGYLNPMSITNALPLSPSHERKPFVASQPATSRSGGIDRLPAEVDGELRRALANLVPVKGLERRPWKEIRYAGTRTRGTGTGWWTGTQGGRACSSRRETAATATSSCRCWARRLLTACSGRVVSWAGSGGGRM